MFFKSHLYETLFVSAYVLKKGMFLQVFVSIKYRHIAEPN